MTAEKNPILRRKSMELLKDLVFENCFMVREIRVIKGPTGLFVSMPAKKQRDSTHRYIAYPANAETRRMIEQAILAEYEKVVAEIESQKAKTK